MTDTPRVGEDLAVDDGGGAQLDVEERPAAPTPADAGLRWWREALYIIVFYGIYSTIRNQFGSASVESETAYEHAKTIIELEQSMHLFFEPTLQSWFLDADWFLWFWNVFYGTFHFIVTAGALIFLYRRFPHEYARWRTALLITTGLALIGFALYPLMPPRLLCTCPYGSGEDYGFVDTLKDIGGLWSFDSGTMQKISNQYAAMPSLHAGWDLLVGLAIVCAAASVAVRTIGILLPVLMTWSVVATANHYVLDVVAGLALALFGYWVALHLDRHRVRSRQERGEDA